MERLTDKKEAEDQRREYENRLKNGYPRNIPEERFLKLAAYEDTGLTPEEIKEVQEAMAPIPFGRFHDIMEAEREERLVVLPCKVGDTVYRVITTRDTAPIMTEIKIRTIGQAADLIGRIGQKRVLLSWYSTREEAEEALKRREEADNDS